MIHFTDTISIFVGRLVACGGMILIACGVLTLVVDRLFRICRSWAYFTDVFIIYVREGRRAAKGLAFNNLWVEAEKAKPRRNNAIGRMGVNLLVFVCSAGAIVSIGLFVLDLDHGHRLNIATDVMNAFACFFSAFAIHKSGRLA